MVDKIFIEEVKEAAVRVSKWADLDLEDQRSEDVMAMADFLSREEIGGTSDGYHTFDELYEHRHVLFAALCMFFPRASWKSLKHDDGTNLDGWFIAGINWAHGPVTYHIPMRHWDRFPARVIEFAPAWDGHTSEDVINRLWDVVTINKEAREIT